MSTSEAPSESLITGQEKGKNIFKNPIFLGVVIGLLLSLTVALLYLFVFIPAKESQSSPIYDMNIITSSRPRLPSFSTTPANLRR